MTQQICADCGHDIDSLCHGGRKKVINCSCKKFKLKVAKRGKRE